MKLNETLLIGGALLAALVLSKGGAVSSIFKKSSVPFMPLENKTISFIENIPQLKIFEQFFPIKDNLQLQNIINIEEKKNQERVGYLQNELDQTGRYISDQQKIINKRYGRGQQGAFLYQSDVQNIQNRYGKITDENTIQYYENNPQYQTQGLTNQYDILIARRNVEKAGEYAQRQQEGIDLINEEYQTRFGNLSRYG